ncbi:MAG: hypothetical protein ACOYXB_07815 [Bacteroidota bacterium]
MILLSSGWSDIAAQKKVLSLLPGGMVSRRADCSLPDCKPLANDTLALAMVTDVSQMEADGTDKPQQANSANPEKKERTGLKRAGDRKKARTGTPGFSAVHVPSFLRFAWPFRPYRYFVYYFSIPFNQIPL